MQLSKILRGNPEACGKVRGSVNHEVQGVFDIISEWDPPSRAQNGVVRMLLALRLRPRAQAIRVVALVDRSGTMAGEPLTRALELVAKLPECLAPGDRFSVLTFSSTTTIHVDNGAVTDSFSARAVISAGGASALEEALRVARQHLEAKPVVPCAIVVLTDGEPTTSAGRRLLDRSGVLGAIGTLLTGGAMVMIAPVRKPSRWGREFLAAARGAGATVSDTPLSAVDLANALVPARCARASTEAEVTLTLGLEPGFELVRAVLLAPEQRPVVREAAWEVTGPSMTRLKLGAVPTGGAVALLALDTPPAGVFNQNATPTKVGDVQRLCSSAATSDPPHSLELQYTPRGGPPAAGAEWAGFRAAVAPPPGGARP